MKKISALVSVLFVGSALSLAACKKDEEKKDDGKAKTTDKKDEGKKDEAKKDEAKKDEGGGGGGGDISTGSAECDELLKIQLCMAKDVPEAKKAVEDSAKAWKDAISNEASKAMTIDTCKQSLGQMKEAAKSVGC